MQMVKRIMLMSAFVGATGMVSASPALSDPKVGTCPDNSESANQWELVTAQSLVDAGVIVSAGVGSIDHNDNGLTCIKFAPGKGQPPGIPTIRDDTVGPHSS